MAVTICINGESTRMEEGITVSGLLAKLGVRDDRVAIEVNLKILGKEDYPRSLVKEGDKIEIIRFVGGG